MKLHKLHEVKTLNEMLDQGSGPTGSAVNVDELNERMKKLEAANQNSSSSNMAVAQQVNSLEQKMDQNQNTPEAKPALNNPNATKPTPGGQARTPDIARF